MRNTIESQLRTASYTILAASATIALWAMTRGLEKPLLGPHSFRQTQTAISAYYMADDPAMFFNYITPVLGPPWQIPMELPVFQWVVARFHNLSGLALDPSGKLISIAAWLLCLAPLAAIGRSLRLPREIIALTAAISLASPLYLFWGAAFLIETTGLLLALGMVALALRVRETGSWKWFLLALAIGSLASTVKATTWAVSAGTGLLLVFFADGLPRVADWKKIALSSAALLLPLLPGKLWLAYGDRIKQANPFAREIILASSANQAAWNFGTWEQKLTPETWQVIFRHIADQLLVPGAWVGIIFLTVVLGSGAFLSRRRLPLILIFLAGFAAGPVVFTNLYFEHSYYWSANGFWLMMAVGAALAGIWESRRDTLSRLACIGLAGFLCISGFFAWSNRFLPIVRAIPSQDELDKAWVRPVEESVPPSRTILIVGNDWNSNALYYAKRKGLAFPTAKWIPFPGPQLDEFFKKLGPQNALGAVVVNPSLLEDPNQAFWEAFLTEKGFSALGRTTAFGILFPALDLKYGSP